MILPFDSTPNQTEHLIKDYNRLFPGSGPMTRSMSNPRLWDVFQSCWSFRSPLRSFEEETIKSVSGQSVSESIISMMEVPDSLGFDSVIMFFLFWRLDRFRVRFGRTSLRKSYDR